MPIHLRANPGDYAEVCLLPGDPLRAKYIAEMYLENAVQVNEERGLLGYTGEFQGQRVPGVLLSGDHARIARWRRSQALWRTWRSRPDLLAQAPLTADDRKLLEAFERGERPE